MAGVAVASSLWVCLVAALLAYASIGPAAGHRIRQGATVGKSFVAENGTAFVSTAMGLQAVLCSKLRHNRRAVVTEDIILDPLAFVPRLRVHEDLSVCGASRDVTVTGVEAFKMASINASLTWCNLTFDLAFDDRISPPPVETTLLDMEPGGTVEYVDCRFYLSVGSFAVLASAVEHQVNMGTGAAATIGQVEMAIDFVALPGATLRRVEAAVRGPTPPPRDEVSVRRTGHLTKLREAGEATHAPLVVTLDGNYSITRCLMRAMNDGLGLEVRRPLTFTGAGGPAPWLVFPQALPRAFLQVRYQVRYVGTNFNNRNIEFSSISGGKRGADGGNPLLDFSVHKVGNAELGCRVVLKDMTLVNSCGYLHSLLKLLLYERQQVGKALGIQKVLDEDVVIHDAVVMDNTTMHVNKFMGWSACLQNVTITCVDPGMRNLMEPKCARSQEGGATGRPLLEPSHYDEPTLEDDPTEGPRIRPSFSDVGTASVGGDEVGLVASHDQDDQGGVVDKFPQLALSACGGALLMAAAVGIIVLSRRRGRCGVGRVGGKRGAPDWVIDTETGARNDKERGEWSRLASVRLESGALGTGRTESLELTPEVAEMPCSPGPMCTKESLIGAITTASAGLEDAPATIETKIAVGGCGVVYKGNWKGVPVAIKTVVFQDLEDAGGRQKQRAVLEAAISSSVAHKNIVHTYTYSFKRLEAETLTPLERVEEAHTRVDLGTVDWKLYIVQEFCDGGSMRECLDKRRVLDPRTEEPMFGVVCQIGLESALGMRHLKCYHMSKKSGLQYHPLFPKFPVTCPIPYAMLCVVCISPKAENRPDFRFIARVLAALKKQHDEGMYSNEKDLRSQNLALAKRLGRMTATEIVHLIADNVGISVTDTSAASASCSRDSPPPPPAVDTHSMMQHPHSVFFREKDRDEEKGERHVIHGSEKEGGDASQTHVDRIPCVASVSVSTERDVDTGKDKEQLSIAWEVDRPAAQPPGPPDLQKGSSQADDIPRMPAEFASLGAGAPPPLGPKGTPCSPRTGEVTMSQERPRALAESDSLSSARVAPASTDFKGRLALLRSVSGKRQKGKVGPSGNLPVSFRFTRPLTDSECAWKGSGGKSAGVRAMAKTDSPHSEQSASVAPPIRRIQIDVVEF
eukprot:evm.model.scf_600EXC.1 EVM.evm.TU.scf_600EXC.1   scf_600EXC:18956-22639(+)